MKVWDKGFDTETKVEEFTVGNDRELDLLLAKYDVQASIAHARMLKKAGILSEEELDGLVTELQQIGIEVEEGTFTIEQEFEDIHSKIEHRLTEAVGDAGKKIHTGRSRNDQVLVCMHLYAKSEIEQIKSLIKSLFDRLIELSEQHKDVLMPGYTHFQVAMPSSFGLWFGAYAEQLVDDLHQLKAAYSVADQNPLGSAAGYGSNLPIDRTHTTEELGFSTLKYNSVSAQMSRGRLEQSLATGLSSVAATLSKMAMDAVLYAGQNHDFISFPDELTTGSSIMPHKKNPDVFELIRGKCNAIQALPNQVAMINSNLPSGYHREYQILKEALFPAVEVLKSCLDMAEFMLQHIEVNKHILDDERYKYLFSVEVVNQQVGRGVPFREAYRAVAEQIGKGTFNPEKQVEHTHEGSIGNLCNEEIRKKFDNAFKG
ncbi:argininosuccinate lyase [Halalkalibaculum sp. DA384]|uniref:argininosuccinate lyase n=1 Tax=Halalkalibaculum sp. DA384 TaxID=3373606 RepID=UPI003753EF3F